MNGKKRIINFRVFLLCSVCVMASIFLAWLYFYQEIVSLLLFMFFVLGLFFVLFRGTQQHGVERAVAFGVCILFSILSYSVYIGNVRNWLWSDFEDGSVYKIVGSVQSNTVQSDNRIIVLDAVTLDGRSVSGKLRLYISEAEGFLEFAREGDVLNLSAKVNGTRIESNYRTDQRYYVSAKQEDVALSLGKPSLLQRIRAKIHGTLLANLEKNYAEISYSMLTGDKDDLPLDVADYYRVSGLAHILAVSGLHVGFLTMILVLPLKKLRANKWLILSIVSVVLTAYVFIADFSPSVIRAAIMGIIGLATGLVGRPRDSLNNLCLACTLLLVVRPLYLFDVGFLMSVGAVLGIILFARPIRGFLMRIRLPKFLSSAIATAISAQLGFLPVSLFYFRSLSMYSLIANVLLINIILITFILLIVGVAFTIILPFFSFIIKAAGYGLFIIDGAAQIISQIPFSSLVVYSLLPIFLCYILYFLASRFVRKERLSTLISAGIFTLCIIIAVACNYPIDIRNTITPVSTSFFDVTSVVTVGEEVYVVGDLQSSYDISRTLTNIRAKKVDAVFINRLNQKTAVQLLNLSRSYHGFTVYFPLEQTMDGLDVLLDKVELIGLESDSNFGTNIRANYSGGSFVCYSLHNQITALFLSINGQVDSLPHSLLEQASIIRSFDYISQTNCLNMINSFEASSATADVQNMHQSKSVIYYYKSSSTKTVG